MLSIFLKRKYTITMTMSQIHSSGTKIFIDHRHLGINVSISKMRWCLGDMSEYFLSVMSPTKWPPFCPQAVTALQWRHNEHNGVSNHRRLECLLNRLSDADQRKHQSSASLAFVRGIHRWPVDSPHKGPMTPKMFPLDDVIMNVAHIQTSTTPHNKSHFSRTSQTAQSDV